jgi:hypothetical protein
MKALCVTAVLLTAVAATAQPAEPTHSHPAPEKLGAVHFATSCSPAVQRDFERAVALLHSFAYELSAQAFTAVAQRDATCAMAHWGIAMSQYHQLWSPPEAAAMRLGGEEVATAQRLGAPSERERQFIAAAAAYFAGDQHRASVARAREYEQAMADLAGRDPTDTEAQVFYALALIATASPADRTHANQKRAAALLEPVFRAQPDHPGAPHYLIHAYDSTELAPQGLAAARAYSKIAPSAPHALHMPSHIFTRLGLWNDSIASNESARDAAHAQGDVGEELHAMDYLTYAYLQRGRADDAQRVVADLRAMGPLEGDDFKVGYAATAMPVRLAMERQRWPEAASLEPFPSPHRTSPPSSTGRVPLPGPGPDTDLRASPTSATSTPASAVRRQQGMSTGARRSRCWARRPGRGARLPVGRRRTPCNCCMRQRSLRSPSRNCR